MINTHLIELSLSGTYFHGFKGVRPIEVLLYLILLSLIDWKTGNSTLRGTQEAHKT